MSITRIRVSGSPRERSEQYGRKAREQMHLIRDGYERAFAAKGTAWDAARAHARQYLPAFEAHAPGLLEELEGIAAGSGLSFDDVLTINCRSEILYAATVSRHAAIADAGEVLRAGARGECSALALEADRSPTGASLVAQNWDWLEVLGPGVVLLEVERDDGPNYVTLVEAGLLAKVTMNAHGLAMGITTLATTLDGGIGGLPFHALIRRLADAPHVSGALEWLAGVPRATSGNYLLAGEHGAILNLETSPGSTANISAQASRTGALAHTNHFLDPIPGGHDLAALAMPDSFVRWGRVDRTLAGEGPVSRAALTALFSDHTDFPNAVCCHPDPSADPRDRWATLASVILHPRDRTWEVAAGRPCEEKWHTIDYGEFLRGAPLSSSASRNEGAQAC